MVYRIFTEKRKELAQEARALLAELRTLPGMETLEDVRLLNRYDAEGLTAEIFESARHTVFSEPQVDQIYDDFSDPAAHVFAVEYLPGQFDQRADSAAQCIQLLAQCPRPQVRSARVYALYGALTDEQLAAVKKYVINPVEAREARWDKPETLAMQYTIPTRVDTLEGFCQKDEDGLKAMLADYGLAMDLADLRFCQQYFRQENREPTVTELRVIDTYWSDHCRHTTFHTILEDVRFESPLLQKSWDNYLALREKLGRKKPICLMDLGTIAASALKREGKLEGLDESDEINACTVKVNITVDGEEQPWLLLFKNETHNHPTEIEPFGGAATCIGGAIRDPLSGRAYVYGAMRLTGAADPLQPLSETIPGKLPQKKIVTGAAAGYSSYGNQIGLATGMVDELYHPGYAAKRMEIGAVVGAAPASNVRREVPAPGDRVILLGGSTGRDGVGGATGSSKAHDSHSVETCGAEVQKGNAPEERKLQRLFRRAEACRMIRRCNDFGAGGVSVAIGELADGLAVDLNAVPKKYEGLDGTELAISESQERMAVVVSASDLDAFLALAAEENLQAVPVATVTEEPRLTMRWNGDTIVDLSREFLSSNGASRHISPVCAAPALQTAAVSGTLGENYRAILSSLNGCSHEGLSQRFDSTIGAGTVLMPFGGKNQKTPIQAMVHKLPVLQGHTEDCSLMSWGYDPEISQQSPYHGAYLAVVESVCKLAATGADRKNTYLTFQEYFAKPGKDGRRWSQPLSALLGAFQAQMDLELAAIGGKDSMSGSFEQLDVPPTLVSFAVTTQKTGDIRSPELKQAGHPVILLRPELDENGLPVPASLLALLEQVHTLLHTGNACACYTPAMGGVAEAIFKMAIGNGLGFRYEENISNDLLFSRTCGCFVLELTEAVPGCGILLGTVTDDGCISRGEERLSMEALSALYEGKLEPVYPTKAPCDSAPDLCYTAHQWPAPAVKQARPRVLIPVFPGTNCEYDSARAMEAAGAVPEILVIRNRTPEDISRSAEQLSSLLAQCQMVFLPGGFSGGDEPDGSGKFITAFFRNPLLREGVHTLLDRRDGLMLGVCNGFQALIKLGLVPYGRIIDADEHCPTLTFNTIARHQSRIVRVRVASNKSPWLSLVQPGEVYSVPISHGEGRFLAEENLLRQLAENGQIATQYALPDGHAAGALPDNPNGSLWAIEGITSPDGRVFGRMGHGERYGSGLYQNVPGQYDMRMFEAAVRYFK